jgi:hypothetical protein
MIHFIVVARRRPPEAGTLLTRIVGSCLRAASARGFCRFCVLRCGSNSPIYRIPIFALRIGSIGFNPSCDARKRARSLIAAISRTS